jgi:hypothetical protein
MVGQTARAALRTLPLFHEPTREPLDIEKGTREPVGSDPRSLVLHIYWSSAIELHAIGSMILRTRYPDERRALLALRDVEQKRMKVALQVLDEVWDVRFGVQPSAAGVGASKAA